MTPRGKKRRLDFGTLTVPLDDVRATSCREDVLARRLAGASIRSRQGVLAIDRLELPARHLTAVPARAFSRWLELVEPPPNPTQKPRD